MKIFISFDFYHGAVVKQHYYYLQICSVMHSKMQAPFGNAGSLQDLPMLSSTTFSPASDKNLMISGRTTFATIFSQLAGKKTI
jgi:hypothetical protein